MKTPMCAPCTFAPAPVYGVIDAVDVDDVVADEPVPTDPAVVVLLPP